MVPQVQIRTVVVDVGRCLGCRSCELACAKAHAGLDDIVEAILSDAPLKPRVRVVEVDGRLVPVQCRHCEDPPCVAVCPTNALHRDEEGGPVRLNEEECVGCGACVVVCPFGAVEMLEDARKAAKCDLCEGIVGPGEEPRCVAACPTRALRLGSPDEVG